MKNCMAIIIVVLFLSCNSQKLGGIKESPYSSSFCKECNDYIIKILKPQLANCGSFEKKRPKFLESVEECNFDSKKFRTHFSCLAGKKKSLVDSILGEGPYYSYSCNCPSQHNTVIYLELFYSKHNRLYGSSLVSNPTNEFVSCLECESLYEKIALGKRIKLRNLHKLIELHGGCFYGKTLDFLLNKLNISKAIVIEDNFQYKFQVELNTIETKSRYSFVFTPSKILEMVE